MSDNVGRAIERLIDVLQSGGTNQGTVYFNRDSLKRALIALAEEITKESKGK